MWDSGASHRLCTSYLKDQWKPLAAQYLSDVPLLDCIVALTQEAFSLYISNLSLEISALELESMFCWSRRVINIFILVNWRIGKKRGVGFVR